MQTYDSILFGKYTYPKFSDLKIPAGVLDPVSGHHFLRKKDVNE